MNATDTNLVFPIVFGAAVVTAALELFMSFLVAEGEAIGPVPADLSTERDARGAVVITLIAVAFLICAGAMLFLHADRQGLVVMPLASLVFCIWSGIRVMICAGGTQRPTQLLGFHGLAGLLVSAGAGSLGLFMLWAPK